MFHKRLLKEFKENQKLVAGMVMTQWITLLANVVLVFALALFVSNLLQGQTQGKLLWILPVTLIAVMLVRGIANTVNQKLSFQASSNVKRRLRELTYEKLMRLGTKYHEAIATSEAVQISTEGVDQLEIYFGKYVPQFFYSLLAPLTLFVIVGTMSLKVAAVLLLCVPLIPLSIVAVQKFAKKLLQKYWGTYTELGDSFLENLQGLTTLKIYQADEERARRMDEEAESFRKITMKVLMMQLNSIIVMDVVAYGGAAAGIIVTLLELSAGRISPGGAVTMILLSSEFFIPMRLLGSFFHIAMNGMAASDRLFDILDLEEGEKGKEALPDGPLSIAFEEVRFSYDGRRQVLNGVSLTVPKTGLISLVGLSGCGKSTIAALVTGGHRGYEGSIRFVTDSETSPCGDGKGKPRSLELSEIAGESLMSHVTLVSHNSYIFKGTVEDNLRMAAPAASEEELLSVLKEVKLYDYVMGQGGLSMKLSERGSNLSGGQCQRLSLARALLHDTPVYIFDEAASNIDAESEEQIMEVIRRLSKERAVLLISHRLANVVESNRIYVLRDGRVAEEGAHRELMEKNGSYAELYLRQKELEEYGDTDRGPERSVGSRGGRPGASDRVKESGRRESVCAGLE